MSRQLLPWLIQVVLRDFCVTSLDSYQWGSVRMALAALSAEIDNHDELLRELFCYRFV